jgi:hypothetical protein
VLDYRTFHFPADDSTRERIMACLAGKDQPLQLPILDELDAVMDTPVSATFEALDAGYPGSKFILTTRNKQPWLDSCLELCTSFVDPYLRDHGDEPLAAYIRAIHEKLYGGSDYDRDRFSRAFDDYHRRVDEYFRQRPRDLLTIDVCAGEGWGPLCAFLGRPEPRTRFPWVIHTEGEWKDIADRDGRDADPRAV